MESVFGRPPPELDLTEFERLGLCRARALCALDAPPAAQTRSSTLPARAPPPLHPRDAAFREGFLAHAARDDVSGRWRAEQISHHILRLALCATRARRRWFTHSELRLFRTRCDANTRLNGAAINDAILDAFIDAAGYSEWRSGEPPQTPTGRRGRAAPKANMMYRVPFEAARCLVRTRRCVVRGGVACVARGHMRLVLEEHLGAALHAALAVVARAVELLPPRVAPILARIAALVDQHTATLGGFGDDAAEDEGRATLAVTAATLGEHASHSFPACTKLMFDRLTTAPHFHLKHEGRLELVTFFNAIGLPLDDALTVVRSNFVRAMPATQWNSKNYAYSIRHLYGEEGRRKAREADACAALQAPQKAPTADAQVHGCPYAHYGGVHLDSMLRASLGIRDEATIAAIVDAAARGDPSGACRVEWRARRRLSASGAGVGVTPLAYFSASRT